MGFIIRMCLIVIERLLLKILIVLIIILLLLFRYKGQLEHAKGFLNDIQLNSKYIQKGKCCLLFMKTNALNI